VVEAASDHIRALTLHIRLVNQQLKAAHRKLHELYAQLIPSEEDEPGQQMRAARRGDPAIHARARKDHPRRAAPHGSSPWAEGPRVRTVEGRDDNRRTMRLDVKHDFLEPVWMALQVPQSAPDLKASGRCRA